MVLFASKFQFQDYFEYYFCIFKMRIFIQRQLLNISQTLIFVTNVE